MTTPDGYGLDKDARLAATRQTAANEAAASRRVALVVPFPYRMIPPDLDFFPFGAAPQGVEAVPVLTPDAG